MSYDISLFDKDFLQHALAEGLGDWTGAPPVPAAALSDLRASLVTEGFTLEQSSFGPKEWLCDTQDFLATVSIFENEVAFSIPFSDRAEASVEHCARIARAIADQHGLGYHDPQHISPEEHAELQKAALRDLDSPVPERRLAALGFLKSTVPTREVVEAVGGGLRGGADEIRRATAECLATLLSSEPDLGTKPLVLALAAALSDSNEAVRTFAAQALAAVGARAAPAEAALRRALDDASYGPRGYARIALQTLASKR